MSIRSIYRPGCWGTVLSSIVVVVGLGLLSSCAQKAVTPAERAEIMTALQKHLATRGSVIMNVEQANVRVRGDTATVKYVFGTPGGQLACAKQRATLIKGEDGWVFENVERKRFWK